METAHPVKRSTVSLVVCAGAIFASAACELAPGTAPLAVPGLLHVSINPRNFVLSTCDSLQLSIMVANSAGEPVRVDSVAWSSSDTLLAPISPTGLVAADTSVGTDTGHVTAYAGRETGSASVVFQIETTDLQLGSGTVVDLDCPAATQSPLARRGSIRQ